MPASLVVILAALALTATGCGSEQETSDAPADDAALPAKPEGPPPKLDVAAPPPAWVETESDAVWLAYSTYCWKTVCADYVDLRCGAANIPTIRVKPGEKVRFHLGFSPRSLGLTLYGPQSESTDVGPATAPLRAERTVEWQVHRDGAVALGATARKGGDARYAACFRFPNGAGGGGLAAPKPFLSIADALRVDKGATVSVQGSLLVETGKARLCSAFAESFPPQCAGPSLEVRGLDPTVVKTLNSEGDVRWSDEPVELTGTVAGGVLNVRDPKP